MKDCEFCKECEWGKMLFADCNDDEEMCFQYFECSLEHLNKNGK